MNTTQDIKDAIQMITDLNKRLVEIYAFADDIANSSTDKHSIVSAKHILGRLEGLEGTVI